MMGKSNDSMVQAGNECDSKKKEKGKKDSLVRTKE